MTIFDQDQPPREGNRPFVDPRVEATHRAAATAPEEWEPDPDEVRLMPQWLRIARALAAVAVIAFVVVNGYQIARSWFDQQLDPVGEPGEAVEVIIPSGATTADIGSILQDLDVIPNSTFFRYYARWNGEENFQAGEYSIPVNSSAQEAIDVLKLGPKPQIYDRFQVREGLWVDEMLPVIAEQLDNVTEAELRAVLDGQRFTPRYRPPGVTSWEGLLFPDTYEVNAEDSAQQVLQKMADEFSDVTGELGFGQAENLLNLSAYEVVIVASLVEAEAQVADERALIASVIYNRLREGWALGIDATCLYGADTRDPQEMINSGILDDPSHPYACRGRTGLPPTPINSPSRASLAAAIEPAETEYMYYVLTDPSGSHTFAETEEEFLAARQICVELGLGCG